MKFTVDDDNLSISVDLDETDHPDADLLADGTGAAILEAAVTTMIESARREQGPNGQRWDGLAAATLRDREARGQSGGQIGYRTGKLLGNLDRGDFSIEPRSATWSCPRGSRWGAMHGFHNGNVRNDQPARPVIGWTPEAQTEARRLVNGPADPQPREDLYPEEEDEEEA
jgi:hypothetical protein